MRKITAPSVFENKKYTVDIIETVGDMEKVLLENRDKSIHLRDKMLENLYKMYPNFIAYIRDDELHIELLEQWKLEDDFEIHWRNEIENDVNSKIHIIENAMDLALLTAKLNDDCPVIFSADSFGHYEPYNWGLAFYTSGKSVVFSPWITDFYEGKSDLGYSDYYTSVMQDFVFEKVDGMLEKLNIPYWTLAKYRPNHISALYTIHKNDMDKLPHYLSDLNTEDCECLESYIICKNAYYLPINNKGGFPLFRARTLEWVRERKSEKDSLWHGSTWENYNGAEKIIPDIGY
jgi:hypothetical protein